MTHYAELARRAGSLVAMLPRTERDDARRVLELTEELGRGFDRGVTSALEEAPNIQLRIELRGLSERLGRRAAEGIPFAALARALSADLHGSRMDAGRIREECDSQLLTFGL